VAAERKKRRGEEGSERKGERNRDRDSEPDCMNPSALIWILERIRRFMKEIPDERWSPAARILSAPVYDSNTCDKAHASLFLTLFLCF
jgi:hypothetical protein